MSFEGIGQMQENHERFAPSHFLNFHTDGLELDLLEGEHISLSDFILKGLDDSESSLVAVAIKFLEGEIKRALFIILKIIRI